MLRVLILSMILIPVGGPWLVHAEAEDPRAMMVSIAPQKYFVEQIAGNRVQVFVMVSPGANPATYEPKPRQLAQVVKSKIYFAIGVPFESVWLKRIAAVNPKMRVVQTDAGVQKMAMGTHAHGTWGMDPHVWLAPPHVKKIAENMLTALVDLDPAFGGTYGDNYRRFLQEIEILDAEIEKMLSAPKSRSTFMVFHPSWGYFAARYGLTQVPVEIEGKAPKPRDLERLIRLARKEKIKSILIQPQFPRKGADVIADAIGGHVVLADPLAEPWADNLRRVARHLEETLR